MKKITAYLATLIVTLASAVILASCGEVAIKRAYVKSGLKDTIVQGTELILDNIQVNVEFADRTSKVVNYNDLTFDLQGFDKTKLGEQKIKITYKDYSFEQTITVVAPEVIGAHLKEGTIPSTVVQGMDINVAGAVLVLELNNGTEKEVSYEDLEFDFTGYDKNGEVGSTQRFSVKCDDCATPVLVSVEIVAPRITDVSIVNGTVADEITVDETLDTSNLKVRVTFENGTDKLVLASDPDLTIDASAINNQVININGYDLIVTYKDQAPLIHKVKVVAKQNAVIKTGTMKTKVYVGQDLNFDNLVLVVTQDDGSTKDVPKSELEADAINLNNFDKTTAGTYTIKITYCGTVYDFVITVEEKPTVTIKAGTLSTILFKGNALDLSKLVLNVVYAGGSSEEVNADDARINIDASNINKDEVGTYQLKVTFDGLLYTFDIQVKEPEIVSSKLKDGISFSTTIEQGNEIDFTNFAVTVTYDDGHTEDVFYGDSRLVIDLSNFDKNKAETQTIKYTVDGKEGSFKIKVEVPAYNAEITSFTSDFKTEYVTNSSAKQDSAKQSEFVQLGKEVKVGSNNAVDFRFRAFAGENERNYSQMNISIKIERFVNDAYVELTGNDLLPYATVDPRKHTIQFTSLANGEKFRITSTILNKAEGREIDPIVIDNVNVIDAYNVYNAHDLSVIDNKNENGYWTELKAEWGLTNVNVKAVVLMGDISITRADLPDGQFYTREELYDGNNLKAQYRQPYGYKLDDKGAKTDEVIALDPVGSIKDNQEHLYVRNIKDDEEFNIYGNYFNINAQGVPKAVYGSDTNTSNQNWYVNAKDGEKSYVCMHKALMRFEGLREDDSTTSINESWIERYASQGVAKIQDVNFLGNGKRDDDADESGGIILCKINSVSAEVNNTIHTNFHIGWFSEYGYNFEGFDLNTAEGRKIALEGNPDKNASIIIKNSKGYESYSSLFYVWGTPNFVIENGEFIGAGGPVMIMDHVDAAAAPIRHQASGTNTTYWVGGLASYVDAINCKLESMVVGSEPWFLTFGGSDTELNPITKVLGQISSTDAGFGVAGAEKTFLKANSDNVKQMNMISIFKFGAKEMPTSAGYSRSRMRLFNTRADYEAYLSTGKLADGTSTHYGYDRSIDWTKKASNFGKTEQEKQVFAGLSAQLGKYNEGFYAGPGARKCMFNMAYGSSTGNPDLASSFTFESSSTGVADYVNSENFNKDVLTGEYVNLYLPNGFGAIFQTWDRA